MPIAPPNSEPVSDIAETAPARSGEALPTITSVTKVNTGARPREKMTIPDARMMRSCRPADLCQHGEPDGRQRQAASDHGCAGRTRRAIWRQRDPTMNAASKRHRPQPGVQRRQPEHQLQVLRDEDEDAKRHEASRAYRSPVTR